MTKDVEESWLIFELEMHMKFTAQSTIPNIDLLFNVPQIVGNVISFVLSSWIDNIDDFLSHVFINARSCKVWES